MMYTIKIKVQRFKAKNSLNANTFSISAQRNTKYEWVRFENI